MAKVIFFKFTVHDKTGKMLDTSGEKTLGLIEGQNQILPRVEKALLAMQVGDQYELELSSEEAYGSYKEELVIHIPEHEFEGRPDVGELFELELEGQERRTMLITNYRDGYYILDGNHPLAGKDVVFKLSLVKEREALEEEVSSGRIQTEH